MQPLTFQFWTLLPDRNISNEIKVYVKKIISLFLLTVKVQYGQLSEKSGALKFLVFNLFKGKMDMGVRVTPSSCLPVFCCFSGHESCMEMWPVQTSLSCCERILQTLTMKDSLFLTVSGENINNR